MYAYNATFIKLVVGTSLLFLSSSMIFLPENINMIY